MKHTKTLIALSCLVAVTLLSGCAASVKSGGAEALTIEDSAKKNLVVNIQGNGKVQQNEDWIRLRQEWNQALKDEATRAGYRLTEAHVADPAVKEGVGIKINVTNFRYLTPGARYAAGVMVGNAWINSSADYSDLQSGRLIGTRTYDTSSSAWEGVMSAMTQEQVEAIAQQIISDIKSAKVN
jgi:outer membrane murein-binding lipoprotein Lpp